MNTIAPWPNKRVSPRPMPKFRHVVLCIVIAFVIFHGASMVLAETRLNMGPTVVADRDVGSFQGLATNLIRQL